MISRRGFLRCALAFVCTCHIDKLWGEGRALASAGPKDRPEKVLRLRNVHTGERLFTRYWVNGRYVQSEVDRINYLLRCHYSNVVKPINIEVINLLCGIKDSLACGEEISIISGYRSPLYNNLLRRLGRHVAAASLHLQGLAIDFAIPGIRTKDLSQIAMQFQAGGVGLYPDFVHIDVGDVRRW